MFLISLLALPAARLLANPDQNKPRPIPLWLLLLLFLIPSVAQAILDINGKSFGEYAAFYLLGFLLLSRDDLQDKLARRCLPLLGLALGCMAAYLWLGAGIYQFSPILFEALYGFYAWAAVLALLGLGKRYLDGSNPCADYLARASFPVYVFHQQWVVALAYFALRLSDSVALQMPCIILGSALLTFATYEGFRRIRATRFLFGMK